MNDRLIDRNIGTYCRRKPKNKRNILKRKTKTASSKQLRGSMDLDAKGYFADIDTNYSDSTDDQESDNDDCTPFFPSQDEKNDYVTDDFYFKNEPMDTWILCYHDSGHYYYYNRLSCESVWASNFSNALYDVNSNNNHSDWFIPSEHNARDENNYHVMKKDMEIGE